MTFLIGLKDAGTKILTYAAMGAIMLQGITTIGGYSLHKRAGEGTYYQGQLATESHEFPEHSIKNLSENEFDLEYLVGIHNIFEQAELDFNEELIATGHVNRTIDSVEELEVIAKDVLPFILREFDSKVNMPNMGVTARSTNSSSSSCVDTPLVQS